MYSVREKSLSPSARATLRSRPWKKDLLEILMDQGPLAVLLWTEDLLQVLYKQGTSNSPSLENKLHTGLLYTADYISRS